MAAAAIRNGQLVIGKTYKDILYNRQNFNQIHRLYASSTNKKVKTKPGNRKISIPTTPITEKRINSVADSLASKGFLRSIKPYSPSSNVSEKIKEIFASFKLPTSDYILKNNNAQKFKILNKCFMEFKHSVPNSKLYEIKTIDDIKKFYETPVNTTVPLDAMKKLKLPENLHIQYDYKRFNPDTDTMFGGQTAFPKSSTLVTGLKYRDKYPGHIAKRSWP